MVILSQQVETEGGEATTGQGSCPAEMPKRYRPRLMSRERHRGAMRCCKARKLAVPRRISCVAYDTSGFTKGVSRLCWRRRHNAEKRHVALAWGTHQPVLVRRPRPRGFLWRFLELSMATTRQTCHTATCQFPCVWGRRMRGS